MAQGIEAFLEEDRSKDLLRFVVVGSVDDGKSTLIGRLLHDSDNVALDHLEAVKKISSPEVGEIDFSLFTDGLQAEREQGITIDVAYRYFATRRRKFIIADTPGHVQYTRNMVTGASNASVAIILIDARLGVLTQTRRHAYIASLLGIPRLLVAVNKMDLVDYDQARFDRIQAELEQVTAKMRFKEVVAFPASALKGDNIVSRSESLPWYEGPTLLDYLEQVGVDEDRNLEDFRFPVQMVLRPNLDYRAFAGRLVSGAVAPGDEVMVLPSFKRSRVKSIDFYGAERNAAQTPQSVALRLEDEVDVSRGDMLVRPESVPQVTRNFEADLVWMDEKPLDLEKTYWLKHSSQWVRVQVRAVLQKLDPETLAWSPAEGMELNDIARVSLSCRRALYLDDYRHNRATGAFVLVDSLSNHTVGGGMVRLDKHAQALDDALQEVRAGSALDPKTQVSSRERQERLGQRGTVVSLVGLPGSGRWALAYALERRLFDLGHTAHVVRPEKTAAEERAALRACADAGFFAIGILPVQTRAARQDIYAHLGQERVVEVYVNTDPALCRERRPKADLSAFEAPEASTVELALDEGRVEDAVKRVVEVLQPFCVVSSS